MAALRVKTQHLTKTQSSFCKCCVLILRDTRNIIFLDCEEIKMSFNKVCCYIYISLNVNKQSQHIVIHAFEQVG